MGTAAAFGRWTNVDPRRHDAEMGRVEVDGTRCERKSASPWIECSQDKDRCHNVASFGWSGGLYGASHVVRHAARSDDVRTRRKLRTATRIWQSHRSDRTVTGKRRSDNLRGRR